jgi:hydroxymethylpyrimidine/phosphomethylpyrimidine kinase
VLDDTNVLAIKTGMLYDQATVQVIASTLKKYYREKPLVLVCDPVCVSTSRHALLADSAVGPLIDEMLPLATLITPNKSEAELILSQKRNKVTISTLADMVSASKELLTFGPKAVLLKGGHVTATMTEVHELLGADPAVSVYKYGLLEENMNILQVGLGEKEQISQLVVDVLQDASGSGGEAATSIFIRPRIESTSTHGTGCTLSAAIVCGLASGLTGNPPSLFALVETNHGAVPEAVRNGTIYTHLGILHAFPVGVGYGPLNHTHSVVSRFVPRCVGLQSGFQTDLNPSVDLIRATNIL